MAFIPYPHIEELRNVCVHKEIIGPWIAEEQANSYAETRMVNFYGEITTNSAYCPKTGHIYCINELKQGVGALDRRSKNTTAEASCDGINSWRQCQCSK